MRKQRATVALACTTLSLRGGSLSISSSLISLKRPSAPLKNANTSHHGMLDSPSKYFPLYCASQVRVHCLFLLNLACQQVLVRLAPKQHWKPQTDIVLDTKQGSSIQARATFSHLHSKHTNTVHNTCNHICAVGGRN